MEATNGGNVDRSRNTFTIHIPANDNPHGIVELASINFVVQEFAADERQFVNVSRM